MITFLATQYSRWLMVLIGLFTASGVLAEPVTLRVHQATVALPRITAYVTVESETGAPITDITAAQFSATVGDHPAQVEATRVFATSDEGLAYIFLVDLSKSLTDSELDRVRNALTGWVSVLRPQDRAAILTFGDQVRLEQDFTADKAAFQKKIAVLKSDSQKTHLHQGLIRAIELGRRWNADLPQRRVIVVLSDGIDDAIGNATRTEVIEALKVDRIPIYAVGLYSPPKTAAKEQGLKALGELARLSGGDYRDGAATPLATALATLRQRLGQTLAVQIHCSACPSDGRPHFLQLTLQTGRQRLASGLDLRLQAAPSPLPTPTSSPEPPVPATAAIENSWVTAFFPFFNSFWGPVIIGVSVGMLVIIGRGLIQRRQRLTPPSTPEPSTPSSSTSAALVAATSPPSASTQFTPSPALTVSLATMGAHPAHVYRLSLIHRAVIGRRADCAVVITDPMVSEAHCVLSRKDDRVFIEDLGSTNGTSLNGVHLTRRQPVQTDDRLLLGGIELRVTIGP